MSDDAQADNGDHLTPSELRWMLNGHIDRDSSNYELLLRCLGMMDRYMKEIERLRAELKEARRDG